MHIFTFFHTNLVKIKKREEPIREGGIKALQSTDSVLVRRDIMHKPAIYTIKSDCTFFIHGSLQNYTVHYIEVQMFLCLVADKRIELKMMLRHFHVALLRRSAEKAAYI